MHLTGEVILLLLKYSYWVVLACALFGGEELIIFFSILAGHGFLTIWKVALIGFFGILISDVFWFIFARSNFADKFREKVRHHFLYRHASSIIEKFSHKHDYIYLALTKFLYGLRIVSIIKVSRRKKDSVWKFILNDSFAIITWGVIMLSLGWLAGRSFFYTINIFDDLHKIIILALGLIVVLYFLEAVVKKMLQKIIFRESTKPKP